MEKGAFCIPKCVEFPVLGRKCERKKPVHRWEINFKLDLKEIGCGSVDFIDLA